MNKDKLFDELLTSWEETYKKGQFSLWVLLALKDGEKYVVEILDFINMQSAGVTNYEEQSLYRLLRKFLHVGIVDYLPGKGDKGPDRKYYILTAMGEKLLSSFIERNIKIFYSNPIQKLIKIKP